MSPIINSQTTNASVKTAHLFCENGGELITETNTARMSSFLFNLEP